MSKNFVSRYPIYGNKLTRKNFSSKLFLFQRSIINEVLHCHFPEMKYICYVTYGKWHWSSLFIIGIDLYQKTRFEKNTKFVEKMNKKKDKKR